VNMNKVYEDFITEIIEEIVSENKEFKNYTVEKQEKFDSLVREKKIITKPDIILRQKETTNYPIIVDAKYKRQENNADYYQVIAYALAIPTAKKCCLIYPEDEPIAATVLTLDTKPFSPHGREIKLHALRVNLFLGDTDKQQDFSEYIKKMKEQISNNLIAVL
jgi:5-methylcytosine-specific restriction endonuclease McrBC regulatory subunit McrC